MPAINLTDDGSASLSQSRRSHWQAVTPIRGLISRPALPPRSLPATTWTTILTIPPAMHRTKPGTEAAAIEAGRADAPTIRRALRPEEPSGARRRVTASAGLPSFDLCANRGISGLKRGFRTRGASGDAEKREQGEQTSDSAATGHCDSAAPATLDAKTRPLYNPSCARIKALFKLRRLGFRLDPHRRLPSRLPRH